MPDYAKAALLLFIVVLAAGIIGGFMAADRGVPVWCILCALLPPLLLLLYFAGPLHEDEGMLKKCNKCGELINLRAASCKYCDSDQAGIEDTTLSE
jgi:hypothetical protein